MLNRQTVLAGAAFASLAFSAAGASATTFLYDFISNDGLETASGDLIATANGDGTYTAVSGTITLIGGEQVAGAGALTANPGAPSSEYSASGAFIYDDQVLPGQNPGITNPGLLFDVAGLEVNIFSNGPSAAAPDGTYSLDTFAEGGYLTSTGAFTLTAVPEPAAWSTMLIGASLAGAAMRRRRQVSILIKSRQRIPAAAAI
jgi:hypothetical protein